MCNNNKYADFHNKRLIKTPSIKRNCDGFTQNKWLNEILSLGLSAHTHVYPLCSLILSVWDDTKYKIQYPFDSTAYRRVKENVTNWKTHASTEQKKKIQQHQQQQPEELAMVHERNQLMYYWWKIYELKPKSHLTKHAQFGSLSARKLYALDLFGNVINLLHLYASKQSGRQASRMSKSECVRWPAKRLSYWLHTKWSALVFICGRYIVGSNATIRPNKHIQTITAQHTALSQLWDSRVFIFIWLYACLLLLFNGTLKSISNEYTFVRSFVRSMLENECKLPICNILDTWQIGNGMFEWSAVDWVFVLFHFDALLPTPAPQPTTSIRPHRKQPVTTNI